ncbi:MAG: antibiotic biosynthesis monooxygenase family protein [Cyanobacteria bacterium J06638_22]
MPIVSKANGLLAEFALFPVQPEQQADLREQLIQIITSLQENSPGFVSGTIFQSGDGSQMTSYIQWTDQSAYVASQAIPNFDAPDIRLYEIFASEPKDSEVTLAPDMHGLINFGTFTMKHPDNQPRFIKLFRQALDMVSGQPGLISTHAHRSLDGWKCINFGHWDSLDDFTAMDTNRPFSPLFGEMLDLADNEYKKELHTVVFTT